MTSGKVWSLIKVKPERAVIGEFLKGIAELSDLRGITFRFYEGKLSSFTLFLNKATWTDAKTFSPVAARRMGLPDNAWSFLGSSGIIKCDGFSVHINSEEPAISLTDEIAAAAEKLKPQNPSFD